VVYYSRKDRKCDKINLIFGFEVIQMARGLGSIYKTNKCNCDNPKWEIRDKRKVRSGKQFGKVIYLIYCYSCKTQWETSASYARELESK